MVSLYEEAEENSEEVARIAGSDHYARFYRYLKTLFPELTPRNYEKALKRVGAVFKDDYRINKFFEALADYIDSEVSKIVPDESEHIVVTYEHYHAVDEDDFEAYRFTDIVAFVKWRFGGKERKIEVYRKEVASGLRVASTRSEFNELVDKIVQEIAAEASAVVNDLVQRDSASNNKQSNTR